MRSLLVVLVVLAAAPAIATDIEFAPVLPAGNPCDPQPPASCFGAVDYEFEISRYEVTNAQYVEFLNAVANETDVAGLYNPGMAGIDFPLVPIGFERFYEVVPGHANRPVDHVSIYDAFRFANWLHHGKPSGAAGIAATEDGAYTMLLARRAIQRNPGARVFVPSRDEWYKAAYYDPDSGYYDYPNGSDLPTLCATPGAAPSGGNCESAVGGVTDVGAYADAASPFGTFDQGGNVWEWTEAVVLSGIREIRGGNWFTTGSTLAAASASSAEDDSENIGFGFRVARAVPEPDALAAGACAVAVVAGLRRRTTRHRPHRRRR